MSRISYAQAKIGNALVLSNEVDLRSHRLVGLHMPAAWTAAVLGFTGAVSGPGTGGFGGVTDENFETVVDDANVEITLAAAGARFFVFRPTLRDELTGLARVKLRSGTEGAPVAQGADRIIVLCLEPRDGSLS
jgi:hypothetical protein